MTTTEQRDLNERLAKWRFKSDGYISGVGASIYVRFGVNFSSSWDPCNDIEQALELLEHWADGGKLRMYICGRQPDVPIRFCDLFLNGEGHDKQLAMAEADTLALAICKALVAAIR